MARLAFYLALAISLLFADLRYHALEWMRQGIGAVLLPMQKLAGLPIAATSGVSDYFSTLSRIKQENDQLRTQLLSQADRVLQQQSLLAENTRLRHLLELKEHQHLASHAADILYAVRDPFSRRVLIDKGQMAGIEAGEPVIDAAGVVGQVTRTYPLSSEITLLTDKSQMLPVMVLRNGLRAALAGAGPGRLELRFLPVNADIAVGDTLVTSGLDDIWQAGLPAARVISIDRSSDIAFARIICAPLAGVENYGNVLVVDKKSVIPLDLPSEEKPPESKKGRKK